VLCQLSYAPRRFEDGHCTRGHLRRRVASAAVRAPSQRRALGALFGLLAVLFAGIAVAALAEGVWPISIAAGALAVWLLSMAARAIG
jgi:hypothetical protein